MDHKFCTKKRKERSAKISREKKEGEDWESHGERTEAQKEKEKGVKNETKQSGLFSVLLVFIIYYSIFFLHVVQ